MMLRARFLLFPVLPVALFTASLAGAQQMPPHSKPSAGIPARNIEIHFDPQSTQIRFKVGSLPRDVRGSFQFKGGALAIDPDSTLAQGELLIDATTGRTGSAARDREMQDEVLESKRYPSIFFHAEHLRGQVPKGDGSSDVIAEGTLNIHGADHPMQMKVHLVRVGNVLSATTHFSVPYVEWGMKNPRGSFFHLSKTVEVDVNAKGTIRTVATMHPGNPSNDSDEESPG
ncbi:MAG TPA: YceI family protein [Acidobacteriaceae bacterium]|jgi:polyisoprenoid-binding protein YceI